MKNWRNAKLLIGGMVVATLGASFTSNSNKGDQTSNNFDTSVINPNDSTSNSSIINENIENLDNTENVALEKIVADYDNLTIAEVVTTNFELPLFGLQESRIAWVSNNPAIEINGSQAIVTRPEYYQEDLTGDLIATLTNNDLNVEKIFSVKVLKIVLSNQEKLEIDYDNLILSQIEVTEDFELTLTGKLGSTITWTSSDSAIVIDNNQAIINRPTFTEGDKTVILTATIENNGIIEEKTFEVVVIKKAITTEEISIQIIEELDEIMIEHTSVSQNFTLPTELDGYLVNWNIDSEYLSIDEQGNAIVNRASFTIGNQDLTVTAEILINDEIFNKSYNIIVVKNDITTAEISTNILAGADNAMKNYSQVSANFTLPTSIDEYSVTWSVTSSYLSINNGNAVVTRPSYTVGNQNATVKFTVVINGEIFTKNYAVTVVKNAITNKEAFDLDVIEFVAAYQKYYGFWEDEELDSTFKNGTLTWEIESLIDGGPISIENNHLMGHTHGATVRITFREYGYSHSIIVGMDACDA